MSAVLLRASGIRHRFGELPVLDGLDVALEAGRLLVVVGPNGAGKTTLLRVLSGVIEPEVGSVELEDQRLGSLTRREIARRVAVVPQEISLPFPFRVEEMVSMGRAPFLGPFGGESPSDREIVARAIRELGLVGFEARRFGTLSGGEKQRVVLARALAQDPHVMLLDEPTAHMDLGHRVHSFEWLRGWIAEHPDQRAALLVTHDLVLAARYADELVLIERGREAASGHPAEVLTPERIASVYNVDARISRDEEDRLVIVALRSRIDYTRQPHGSDH
jgi:iron complex transport system ATP-binding protein